MMGHGVMYEGSVGGIGRRKAEARIVPLCRLPNESLSSNKAKKLLEDRSGCIKSRFVYVWIKSLKKCRIIASRMPGGTCESKSVIFCKLLLMFGMTG